MAKDPRMSALEKVAGMVKGVGRAMSGSMSDRMEKPKPNAFKKAGKVASNATREAVRVIGDQSGLPMLTPAQRRAYQKNESMRPVPVRQTPAMKARSTMRGAGKAVGDVGRGVR